MAIQFDVERLYAMARDNCPPAVAFIPGGHSGAGGREGNTFPAPRSEEAAGPLN